MREAQLFHRARLSAFLPAVAHVGGEGNGDGNGVGDGAAHAARVETAGPGQSLSLRINPDATLASFSQGGQDVRGNLDALPTEASHVVLVRLERPNGSVQNR